MKIKIFKLLILLTSTICLNGCILTYTTAMATNPKSIRPTPSFDKTPLVTVKSNQSRTKFSIQYLATKSNKEQEYWLLIDLDKMALSLPKKFEKKYLGLKPCKNYRISYQYKTNQHIYQFNNKFLLKNTKTELLWNLDNFTEIKPTLLPFKIQQETNKLTSENPVGIWQESKPIQIHRKHFDPVVYIKCTVKDKPAIIQIPLTRYYRTVGQKLMLVFVLPIAISLDIATAPIQIPIFLFVN